VLRQLSRIGQFTVDRTRRKRRLRVPPEVSLLGRLGAELERAGVRAEPGPDKAALLVYQGDASLPVWVFVGSGGSSFSWESGHKHHPVTDVGGAAVALAAYVGGEAR
jgi:hypothetical protein